MYRKLITLLIIVLLGKVYSLNAQVVAQFSYIGPVGETAYLVKPSIGVELIAKPSFGSTNHLRFNIGVGYHGMQPTKDTFKTYTIQGGNGSAFLPSYEVIRSYSVVPFSFGAEYKLLNTNFSPFIGIDGNFFVINMDYHNHIETVMDEDGSDLYWELGVLPKIGVTYNINNAIQLYAGVGYSLGIVGTTDTQAYWKTFLSVGYKFDEDESNN
jgi:hypothetical protein